MYKNKFKINTMCKVLKVSRSGYYRWQKSQVKQECPNHLLNDIRRVFIKSRKSYGSPRIYRQLKAENVPCGRHRVARYMREDGIVARKRRKYKKPISKQRIQAVADNILNRKFQVNNKNSIMLTQLYGAHEFQEGDTLEIISTKKGFEFSVN